jgi:hypothetical protein
VASWLRVESLQWEQLVDAAVMGGHRPFGSHPMPLPSPLLCPGQPPYRLPSPALLHSHF